MRQLRTAATPGRASPSLWIYTMNRCNTLATRRGLALAVLALSALPALAQTPPVRAFPDHALRGKLVITQPPSVTLDGKAARLSPGARIKGPNNMLVMSASLVGRELTVNYTVEHHGLVHDVWILTEAEAALKRKRAGE
jgi:hypothetical protein